MKCLKMSIKNNKNIIQNQKKYIYSIYLNIVSNINYKKIII